MLSSNLASIPVRIGSLVYPSSSSIFMRTGLSGHSYPLTPFLVIADLCVLYFTAVCAAKFGGAEYFSGRGQMLALSATPFMVILFAFTDVYQSWRLKGAYYFFQRIFVAVWFGFALVSIGTVLFDAIGGVDRRWFVVWFMLANAGLFGYRLIAGLGMNWMRVHGVNNRSVVLIGGERQIQDIQTHFWQNAKFGIDVVHTVTMDKKGEHWSLSEFDTHEIQQRYQPDDIWLCMPLSDSHRIKDLMYQLRDSLANIRYIPQASDLLLFKQNRASTVMGFNSIDLNYSPLSGSNHYLKLWTDMVFATIILLLISPVMLIIAIGVKVTSDGPVFFKQKRLGIVGRPITVYKFRSMAVHSETEGQVTQATKNDARITPFGAFLRSSSLDELPQFINVLQGRMSIVGPRPHAIAHNDYYRDLVDSYMLRHRVKPGITGWAQINGCRGETDTLDKMEKRVQHDLWYIENWSLWLDIRIIITTAFKGFISPNAY